MTNAGLELSGKEKNDLLQQPLAKDFAAKTVTFLKALRDALISVLYYRQAVNAVVVVPL